MDRPQRLQLAQRIHLGLMRELGQGLDLQQMLRSPLYARDVLLVCQAYPDSELPWLAEQFRRASAEPAEQRTQPPSGWGRASSGFDAFAASLPVARPAARRWLAPSTWFAR